MSLGDIGNMTEEIQQSFSELSSFLREARAVVEAAETTVQMAFNFLNSVSFANYCDVLRDDSTCGTAEAL